ncbi:MAG: hypothetical protein QOG58_2812 [Caballeronia sp.]|nr:hypothetical protein [Caballeronia sp.]
MKIGAGAHNDENEPHAQIALFDVKRFRGRSEPVDDNGLSSDFTKMDSLHESGLQQILNAFSVERRSDSSPDANLSRSPGFRRSLSDRSSHRLSDGPLPAR